MTSVTRGRTSAATWLTGATGLLMLAVAAVLMVIAAPTAGRAGPGAVSARAQAYTQQPGASPGQAAGRVAP